MNTINYILILTFHIKMICIDELTFDHKHSKCNDGHMDQRSNPSGNPNKWSKGVALHERFLRKGPTPLLQKKLRYLKGHFLDDQARLVEPIKAIHLYFFAKSILLWINHKPKLTQRQMSLQSKLEMHMRHSPHHF